LNQRQTKCGETTTKRRRGIRTVRENNTACTCMKKTFLVEDNYTSNIHLPEDYPDFDVPVGCL
jgi:hypothetical protein